MKFFKITNLDNGVAFFVSSESPDVAEKEMMRAAPYENGFNHRVEEVTAKEFYGYPPKCIDLEVDDDWQADDDCEYYD